MAFNFGAFAGGLAKGGIDAYTTIKEQTRRDQEAEQRAQEFEWRKNEQAGKEGLRQAIGEMPSGDTIPVQTMVGATGGIDEGLPMVQEKITPEQKMENFRRRAIQLGADPTAVQMYEKGGLELSTLRRGEKRATKEDEFSEWLAKSQDQIKADPVQWARDHVAEYNKAKPGSHLDDKLTADVVASADGKSHSFVQKNAEGKVVSSTPIDSTTAQAALQHVAFGRYMALPGKFKEATEISQKERGLGIEERRVQLTADELQAKLKVDLFGAQANQANASANASNAAAKASIAHAGVYNNMVKMSNESRDARAALKPFLDEYAALSPEDQAGAKGQSVLLKGATAAAQKSGDMNAIIAQLKKPDANEAMKVNADGTVTKGGVLYVPDPNKPGDYKPAGGLGQSALDQAIAAELKGKGKPPAAAATPPAAAPKAAIPPAAAKPAQYGNISPELRGEVQAKLQATEVALAQAQARAQAAVQSQDVKSITAYGAEVNRLRAERDTLAASPLLK